MWGVRTYRGAMAEHAATRAWAAADRQGARPGTAAAVPAVLRQGSGRGVDQVEGDELVGRAPISRSTALLSQFPLSGAELGRLTQRPQLQDIPVLLIGQQVDGAVRPL